MKHWMSTDNALEFDLKATETLRGPGVYAYLTGDTAIYVGCSKKVVGRALARNHHLLKELAEATSLMIFPCKDLPSAKELEMQMISDLQPKLNMRRDRLWRARKVCGVLGSTAQSVLHQYLPKKPA